MAPLGEWSLEATDLVGARGITAVGDVIFRGPVRRRPPDTGGERVEAQADSAKSRRLRTG
jgi:hypothetical protein